MLSFKHYIQKPFDPVTHTASFDCPEYHTYTFTPDDINALNAEVDSMEWHDILGLYGEDELDWSHLTDQDYESHPGEEDDHPDNEFEYIDEDLSAAARSQKRLVFARSKQRRRMAAKISLHRASNPFRLKQRSKNMARRIITKRILRGRTKSQLSSQEKNRLEKQLKNAGQMIMLIAQRMMPKIRSIEQTRIRHRVKESALPPEAFNNVEGPVTVPVMSDITAATKKAQLVNGVRNLKHAKQQKTTK